MRPLCGNCCASHYNVYPKILMVFREFLTRLGGRRDRETHSEAVPPRPQSQPTPFRPIPPTDHHPRPDPAPKFKRGHNLPVPNADESKPVGLSSYTVDPTAAYENNPGHKPGRKSTLHASTRLAIDVLKESSDAFAPLKSVAGGLSAIIKHCDVRSPYFANPFAPLTVGPANDGEP